MSDELAEAFAVEDSSETAETVEATESETAEEVSEAPEGEPEKNTEPTSDKEVSKDDPDDDKSDEYSANEKALYKQAKDERQKRQERDERIRELESKLAEIEKPKEKHPDVFEDQEGFTESLRSEFQQELTKAKLDVARDMMMSFHDDYEDVEAMVLDEIKGNPVLKAELQQSPNIARAVYDYGKKLQKHREMKDFNAEEYESKLRAEIKAELKAELEKELKTEKDNKADDLSPSLASVRGSNVNDEKEVSDIGDVFS